MLHPSITKAIDEIDAALFSDNCFEDPKENYLFAEKVIRWLDRLQNLRQLPVGPARNVNFTRPDKPGHVDDGRWKAMPNARTEPSRVVNPETIFMDAVEAAHAIGYVLRDSFTEGRVITDLIDFHPPMKELTVRQSFEYVAKHRDFIRSKNFGTGRSPDKPCDKP